MDLIPLIAEPDNLRIAFLKAARGKRNRHEVINFTMCLDKNLAELREGLLAGNSIVGDYRFFRIYDPKERLICAASFHERVMHHAVMNICDPVFERYSIFDSYACRVGKGLHKALHRAQQFSRQHDWYLKLDIRKYFDSINHEVLLDMLRRRFRDARLLDLFRRVVRAYETAPGTGLPIGNLLSQHFANFYLGRMDHWLKEERHVTGYLRYMDDYVLFARSREELKEELSWISCWLAENLRLTLKEPIQLNRTRCGLPMLGFRVYPGRLLLAPRSRQRFVRKLAYYESETTNGLLTGLELARRVSAIVAFTKTADADGFRRRIIMQRGWSRGAPTVSNGAAVGTTPPTTRERLTGTTTPLTTGTTTWVSG